MKKIISLACMASLSLAFSIAAPSVSRADYINGNTLYSYCTEPESSPTYYQLNASCLNYIIGIHDGFDFFSAVNNENSVSNHEVYCVPDGVTAGQLREIVTRYLRNNPEMRHEGASGLVVIALMTAYPCS